MNKENNEKKCYVLVAYNLSDKQKGIQAAHAIVEYEKITRHMDKIDASYVDWTDNWKTIIMLDGGTSNNNKDSKYYGSLQRYRDDLHKLGVVYSEFYEPDYNDGLTAVAFIVDMIEDTHILGYLRSMNLA